MLVAKKKNNYYAFYLLETKEEGILDDWKSCEKKVKGVNARYKGFVTKDEASKWLESGAKYKKYVKKTKSKKAIQQNQELEEGIYFDSGTGRKKGVEVKLTNEKGEDLLHEILGKEILTKHNTYNLGKDVTNNFGELTACLLAIQLAIKNDVKKVFGDSDLVIKYWSKGKFREGLPEQTTKLIHNITQLRKEFEEKEDS